MPGSEKVFTTNEWHSLEIISECRYELVFYYCVVPY